MGSLFGQARMGILGDLLDPTTSGLGSLDTVLGITGNAPIYAALHTARPLTLQTDSEVSYTGPYARVVLIRTTAGLNFTVDQVLQYIATNASSIAWAPCTAGSTVARWISFGTKSIGAAGTHTLIAASPICATAGEWLVGMCLDTTNDIVTVSRSAHNANPVAEGDEVAVVPVYDGTFPTSLSITTPYFVKTGTLTVGTDAVTFKLATVSAAGTAFNFTDSWPFQFIKLAPLTISSGVTPTVGAGTGKIIVT